LVDTPESLQDLQKLNECWERLNKVSEAGKHQSNTSKVATKPKKVVTALVKSKDIESIPTRRERTVGMKEGSGSDSVVVVSKAAGGAKNPKTPRPDREGFSRAKSSTTTDPKARPNGPRIKGMLKSGQQESDPEISIDKGVKGDEDPKQNVTVAETHKELKRNGQDTTELEVGSTLVQQTVGDRESMDTKAEGRELDGEANLEPQHTEATVMGPKPSDSPTDGKKEAFTARDFETFELNLAKQWAPKLKCWKEMCGGKVFSKGTAGKGDKKGIRRVSVACKMCGSRRLHACLKESGTPDALEALALLKQAWMSVIEDEFKYVTEAEVEDSEEEPTEVGQATVARQTIAPIEQTEDHYALCPNRDGSTKTDNDLISWESIIVDDRRKSWAESVEEMDTLLPTEGLTKDKANTVNHRLGSNRRRGEGLV